MCSIRKQLGLNVVHCLYVSFNILPQERHVRLYCNDWFATCFHIETNLWSKYLNSHETNVSLFIAPWYDWNEFFQFQESYQAINKISVQHYFIWNIKQSFHSYHTRIFKVQVEQKWGSNMCQTALAYFLRNFHNKNFNSISRLTKIIVNCVSYVI